MPRSISACVVVVLSQRPATVQKTVDVDLGPDRQLAALYEPEAVALLVDVTYRHRILMALGCSQMHFLTVSKIAERIPVYRLTRIHGENDAEALADLVQSAVGRST